MMKNLELEKLRKKCLLYNKFLVENMEMPSAVLLAFEESNRLIEEAYQKGDSKPLKAMSRDIDEGIRTMSRPMLTQLENLFKEQLGETIESFNKRRINDIKAILKRKRIKNDEEYELLQNRADEISGEPSHADELEAINKLLVAYHQI